MSRLKLTFLLLILSLSGYSQSVRSVGEDLWEMGLITDQKKYDQMMVGVDEGIHVRYSHLLPFCDHGRLLPLNRHEGELERNLFFIANAMKHILPETRDLAVEIRVSEIDTSYYVPRKEILIGFFDDGKPYMYDFYLEDFEEDFTIHNDDLRGLVNTMNTLLADRESPYRFSFAQGFKFELFSNRNEIDPDFLPVIALTEEQHNHPDNPFVITWMSMNLHGRFWSEEQSVSNLYLMDSLGLISNLDQLVKDSMLVDSPYITNGADWLLLAGVSMPQVSENVDDATAYESMLSKISSGNADITLSELKTKTVNDVELGRSITISGRLNKQPFTLKFSDDGYERSADFIDEFNKIATAHTNTEANIIYAKGLEPYAIWLTPEQSQVCRAKEVLRFTRTLNSEETFYLEEVLQDSGQKN